MPDHSSSRPGPARDAAPDTAPPSLPRPPADAPDPHLGADASEARLTPHVVVVGAATRDLTPDDPRGWRLGGPVTYASLALARLGLRVTAIVGADAEAASAREFDLHRTSGMDLRLVPLARGPVFENRETPTGRIQRGHPSDPMPATLAADLLGKAADVTGWFFAPVATELGDDWASAPAPGAHAAVGWQGLLRTFQADGSVTPRAPEAIALIRRADLVGVGSDDLTPGTGIPELMTLIAPTATLILTHGAEGGIVVDPASPTGHRAMRWYKAVEVSRVLDVTGAGDTFLAALFAARLEPRLLGGRTGGGLDLFLAASAASLVVESVGMDAVPMRSAVRDRMRDARAKGHPTG